MDIFLEYLLRKKSSGIDVVKKLGLVLAAVAACVIIIFAFSLVQFLRAYILLGIAAVIYGLVVLMRNFSLEYEYIFTNGDLDIDIVKAQTTRKRMVNLSCKNIELMASDKNMNYKRDFESDSISKKFNAVYDASLGGIYHVLFVRDGERIMLTFQPPVKLLAAMKKMNPRCVNLDPEDVTTVEE